MEKSHNFSHLIFCSETYKEASTNIPPGAIERIFEKFPWEGAFFAAGKVM